MNRGLLITILLIAALFDPRAMAQEPKAVALDEIAVSVRGSVKKPGIYKLTGSSMIMAAINAAGGPSDGPSGGGNLHDIRVIRGEETFRVNTAKIRTHAVEDFALHDGDKIEVPEAYF